MPILGERVAKRQRERKDEKLHGVQKISYPYLFDEELKVKDTFFAALGDATIKGY